MCVCVYDSRGWKRNVEIFIDSVLERKRKKGARKRERRLIVEREKNIEFLSSDENGEENGWFSQALS